MRKEKSKIHIFLAFLLFVCSLNACSKRGDVLSRNKMADVLYDIQLAQAIIRTQSGDFHDDEAKDALLESVYKQHNITKARLDSSLVWYADHPQEYNKVNDIVATRFTEEKDKIDGRLQRLNAGRNVNPDLLPKYARLSEQEPLFAFSLDSIRLRQVAEDSLFMKFDIIGLNPDLIALSSITFGYKDTLVVQSDTLRESPYTLYTPVTGDTLSYVSGYIRVKDTIRSNFELLLYNIEFDKTIPRTK